MMWAVRGGGGGAGAGGDDDDGDEIAQIERARARKRELAPLAPPFLQQVAGWQPTRKQEGVREQSMERRPSGAHRDKKTRVERGEEREKDWKRGRETRGW